ncbi:hypothetical protein CAMGR0001_0785 [Campylobacter gracilis RM3268]|uniref:Uncharacterized protein n=1 Tax=Campylobacter gracilis RM3268 TaxID=553220 RepID=C8PFZ2_9BACT|nr:hypothetical protein CAMGR0001_0785 [Campylobacter gracilis RM3268]
MPALPTSAESGAMVASPKNIMIADTTIKYTSLTMIDP